MTEREEEKARRLYLFDKTRDELLHQQMSNSETYDKSLLTLSSAFLGISLAFIKDFVTLQNANSSWLLMVSWIGFSLVIIGTIWSFIYGQRVIKKLMVAAEKYYKERDQNALNISAVYSKKLDRLNEFSGLAFIAAVILSISFVLVNLNSEDNMTKEIKTQGETLKKSRPVNQFQEAPKPQNQGQTGQQQRQSSGNNNSQNKK